MPVSSVGQGTVTTFSSILVWVKTTKYSGFVLNNVERPEKNEPSPSLTRANAGMAKPPINSPIPFKVSLTATDFNPPKIA